MQETIAALLSKHRYHSDVLRVVLSVAMVGQMTPGDTSDLSKIAELLLEAGGSVQASGRLYWGSPVHFAAARGATDAVVTLMGAGANVSEHPRILADTVRRGHVETVKLLLNSGVDVTGFHRRTLTVAVRKGHFEIVRLLLEAGAGVHLRDRYGKLALAVAAWGGNVGIVKLLLEAGAEVCEEGGKAGSALFNAALKGHLDVVKLLVQSGADVCARKGRALLLAAKWGHIEVVKFLC
ncbi:hypothetical protein HDV00_011574 [Rhizophlyctis rosea]|nr:hypothetical protein HDV00_011574 [Rhizophlyctis rosea]